MSDQVTEWLKKQLPKETRSKKPIKEEKPKRTVYVQKEWFAPYLPKKSKEEQEQEDREILLRKEQELKEQSLKNKRLQERLLLELRAKAHRDSERVNKEITEGTKPVVIKIERGDE